LITADFALEQGRDLFVGTAGLDGGGSAGTRNLVEQGAPVVDTAAEILADWGRRDPVASVVALDEPTDAAVLAAMMKSELDGRLFRHRGGYFERRSG
jgi:DNA processing protein